MLRPNYKETKRVRNDRLKPEMHVCDKTLYIIIILNTRMYFYLEWVASSTICDVYFTIASTGTDQKAGLIAGIFYET